MRDSRLRQKVHKTERIQLAHPKTSQASESRALLLQILQAFQSDDRRRIQRALQEVRGDSDQSSRQSRDVRDVRQNLSQSESIRDSHDVPQNRKQVIRRRRLGESYKVQESHEGSFHL